MRIILILGLLLTSIAVAFAQPVALPLTTNPVLQEYAKAHPDRAQAQLKSAPAALTLPFMDDFSYAGPYPTDELWMDNQAFVNGTLGIDPPSIGMATLDGLDSAGLPYGDGEGWADTLTSQVIDLSIYEESDSIIFSFFAQPQGYGDEPESIDSLIVEFKNNTGDWRRIKGIPGSVSIDFQYYTIALTSQYINSEFQFRFRNYNARTGFVDLWHIDYIKIDKDRVEGNPTFEDVCFTKAPHSVLEEFTAMPWAHFQQDILGETFFTIDMNLKNHSNTNFNLSGPFYTVDETLTANNILEWNNGTTNASANISTVVYDNNSLTTSDFNYSNLPTSIMQAVIETKYYFTNLNQENITNQRNFNFINDTVTTKTIFANYLAYDDGTAEYNVGLNGAGSQAAVRFRPNVDDQLKGIQIHIPYAADDVTESQSFTLKVWNSSDSRPDSLLYELYNVIPQYGQGIAGFYTYPVDPPLAIDGGTDYFIGWEQVSVADSPIPIGIDRNNVVASENNYYDLGLGWQPFPDNLQGALMIRALVNGDPVGNEPVINASEIAEIFPNPVNDELFIDLKTGNYQNYSIKIFNLSGQALYENTLTNSVPVTTFQTGIYIIQLTENNTDKVYYHKFVKD